MNRRIYSQYISYHGNNDNAEKYQSLLRWSAIIAAIILFAVFVFERFEFKAIALYTNHR